MPRRRWRFAMTEGDGFLHSLRSVEMTEMVAARNVDWSRLPLSQLR